MPTALARKDRVASRLWRDRTVARSAALDRRAPGLDAPVRGPPVLGTPVLGPPVSGASLAVVLSAGVLRLAPRPPVVVTPLPRSHGDRSHRPRRYAGPLTCRAHVPLSFLQGEVPPSSTHHRRRQQASSRVCAQPTQTRLADSSKRSGKNDQTKAPLASVHGLRSGAAARARRYPAPDAAGASCRRPARRGPPDPCSPHRPW